MLDVLPLNDLVAWLNGLPLSMAVRRSTWAIPLMSTLHILAIGMIMSSVIMIDLRVWGVSRSHSLVQSTQRFAPWVWAGLVLLTVTGGVLVVGQPRRFILEPTFQIKMALMLVAIAVTIGFQIAVVRNSLAWSEAQRVRVLAGLFAAVTLFLWIVVTFAGRGRWITTFLR